MSAQTIWDKARLLVQQSPTPTTMSQQLSKLSRRRRYGVARIRPDSTVTLEPTPKVRYWWQEEN